MKLAMGSDEQSQAHSLLDTRVGRKATVRAILFECLRERCGELGLREGDSVVVDGREGDSLLIRSGAAGSVRCPSEVARFVEVE